jgi:hypothetical protein
VVHRIADNDTGVGTIAVADVHEKREDHGEQDALLDTEDDDGCSGDECKEEFTGCYATNCGEAV